MAAQHDKGKNWVDGKTVKQVAETDGTTSEQVSANLMGWDATAGAYVKLSVDHATGNLNTSAGAGGGGAATIADGADVAQGATTDVAWVSGAGTVISLLKKIASAGGSAVSVADGADVAQGATTDLSSANTVVGILKAIKAAVQGTLTVATHAVTQSGAWSVTADTELPAASVLADADPNPTTSRVAANGMLWNGATWDRAPGSAASGLKIQSAQLPAALGTGGGLKVDGSGTALPVSGTFFQGTQPVSLAAAVDVSDRSARLVGRARLTDDTNLSTVKAASTLAVATDTALVVAQRDAVDVSDRAARLLGVVDKGKVWDGTNIAAVKAASALAVATDPALVVQHAPQRADASTLWVTTISAANTTVTLTLPAAAAGLFHYITHIEIVNLNPTVTAIAAAATTLSYTTTNLPGSPAFSCGNLLAAGGTFTVANFSPATPIKSSVAATATTFVAPAIGTGGLCRINVTYYTAP